MEQQGRKKEESEEDSGGEDKEVEKQTGETTLKNILHEGHIPHAQLCDRYGNSHHPSPL